MKYLKQAIFTLLITILAQFAFAQTILDVVIGTNNIPITQVQLTHDGNVITQTLGSNTNTVTTLPVTMNHFIVDDGGTQVIAHLNNFGTVVRNNNFASNVVGVGIHEEGNFISATNASIFEPALEKVVNGLDLMNFLYYDYTNNLPSGDDFDILFAKGILPDDYVVVGERDGNTDFVVTPLDIYGNPITSARRLRFGEIDGTNSGNGTSKYDWDIGFSPTNQTGQSMVYTVVDAELFDTGGAAIYGFRIDNNGQADVKFFGLSGNSFKDNPNNTNVGGLIGNVFNDANGITDNTVDGTAISSPESTQLHATLYNNSTLTVIATTPIETDGSYEFLNLDAFSNYGILTSTNAGVPGNSIPTINLPTDWMNTGENLGTSAGHDGTIDGNQAGLAVAQILVQEVNFGIEKRPEADSYSFEIPSPGGNSYFTLGSGITSELSGDDDEDGTFGTNDEFGITSLPTNGNHIFYDGSQITLGQDGSNAPSLTNPFVIPNYDPALLEIRFTGVGSVSTSFNYITIDAAGYYPSTEASYELTYSGGLPVEWANFDVKKVGQSARITFATEYERSSSHFIVQKSLDGNKFQDLQYIIGKGSSSYYSEYSYSDKALSSGTNYYRIMQVDADGAVDYTAVKSVIFNDIQDAKIFPNPVPYAEGSAIVKYYSSVEDAVITISNMMGRETKRIYVNKFAGWNTTSIDIRDLTPGMYALRIGDKQKAVLFTVAK